MSVVEQQLTGYFTDCLGHGYLRLKVMGQNPTSLQAAVKVAVDEQNLRARFNLRSGLEPVIQHPIDLEHTPIKSRKLAFQVSHLDIQVVRQKNQPCGSLHPQ